MTVARGAIIIVTALWFARLSKHERDLHRHVQTLEGLLPICAFCKNIRTDGGNWERLETFISKRSTAQFSHGFCPTCAKTHYADYLDDDTCASRGRERRPHPSVLVIAFYAVVPAVPFQEPGRRTWFTVG